MAAVDGFRGLTAAQTMEKLFPNARYIRYRPQQPKRKNPMFQAYQGVTGAQHQANFDNLSAQGYRMISLTVYGDPGNPLYAAVWVQRSGPAWEAVHGVDAAGYQAFFDTWTAKGYVPVGYRQLQ